MLNPSRTASVPGSHSVSPWNFVPEVGDEFDFPSPLALVDSTLRKTYFTAGHTTSRRGFQVIAAALEELGVRDESINVNWAGSTEPSPQDWALLEAVVEGGFSFRLNVYADVLLGDGRTPTPVPVAEVVARFAEAGIRILAPGIVPAPDPAAERRQAEDLEAYFAAAAGHGLETTITLANVGRRDLDQLLRGANLAARLGATRFDLMDSTSSMNPEAMKVFVRRFRAGLEVPVPVTMHVHDEFGLATAGAVAAATAGASPDVSVNGMSYRCGFAPLEEVVLALETLYGVDTGIVLDRITETSRIVARESGLAVPALKPLTGGYAYLKHMPGDAATAIREGQDSFPPISHGLVPAVLGQQVEWVWGGLSSDGMVTALAASLGEVLGTRESAALRRALDAAVSAVPAYPRWLTPAQATDLVRSLLPGLRREVDDARGALEVACPFDPWIERVLTAGPRTGADLVAAARDAVLTLPDGDLAGVCANFSRLGVDEQADDERGNLSRTEESRLFAGSDAVRAELVELTGVYEGRHGLRYVAAAAGLSGPDLLARLRTRVEAEPVAERNTARHEVATIVDGRLIGRLRDGTAARTAVPA